MNKIPIFKLHFDGSWMASKSLEYLLEEATAILDAMSMEDRYEEITLSVEPMEEEEYNNIPEFEGW